MAAILNNLTRLGVAVALIGGAANSMLYNGKPRQTPFLHSV